jgi:iron complex outermembrane receptor protein
MPTKCAHYWVAILLDLLVTLPAFAMERAAASELYIGAQPLDTALVAWSKQTGYSILIAYRPSVDTQMSSEIMGSYTPERALALLLMGTELTYEFVNSKTVAVRVRATNVSREDGSEGGDPPESRRSPPPPAVTRKFMDDPGPSRERGGPVRGLPEVLVRGSVSLNTDIRRTSDDVQPYVVFDRAAIEQSGAADLQTFFKNRLTMSVSESSNAQTTSLYGNSSSINLRGLGSDETLILVDGRRLAGINAFGTPGQPDINGIPLAAIERIEILPSTASGIYGGGATGGVINIVLRRDYTGTEVKAGYGNTFSSDVATRRVDLNSGWNLGGGATRMLFTGSFSDSNDLLQRERPFIEEGRQRILANNPSFFFAAASPPLGATPNIRSSTGTNLVLKSGEPLNAPIAYIPSGYSGTSDGGAALLATAGKYNLEMANTAEFQGATQSIASSPTTKSLMVSIQHDFSPRFSGFLEGSASDNTSKFRRNATTINALIQASAPNNPFMQAIRVRVPALGADGVTTSEIRARRAAGGVVFKWRSEWQSAVDFTWTKSRADLNSGQMVTQSTKNKINAGAIDVLKDINAYPIDLGPITDPPPNVFLRPFVSTMRDTSIRLGGPVPWFGSRKANLSAVLEHRHELLNDTLLVSSGTTLLTPSREQAVDSIYVETVLPIVEFADHRRGIRTLEVQLAGRHDAYRAVGTSGSIDLSSPSSIVRIPNRNSSTDPTIGIRYQPIGDFTFRTSYGRGYLPPSVAQLAPLFLPFERDGSSLQDPKRGGERLGQITVSGDGSGKLRPEQSKSWSAGLIVEPRGIPGFRASIDWTRIEKRDNIASFSAADALANEDYISGIVTRGVPSGGFSVGPVTSVNTGLFNIATLDTSALDMALAYTFHTNASGDWSVNLNGTHLLKLQTQAVPNAPVVENAGVSTALSGAGGGLRWIANGSLRWIYKDMTVGWTTRFYASYFVNVAHSIDVNQGSAVIPSQMYHDLFASLRFGRSLGSFSGALANAELQLGINNIFGKRPPIDVTGVSSSTYYSHWGDPRLATYYVAFRKSFAND